MRVELGLAFFPACLSARHQGSHFDCTSSSSVRWIDLDCMSLNHGGPRFCHRYRAQEMFDENISNLGAKACVTVTCYGQKVVQRG